MVQLTSLTHLFGTVESDVRNVSKQSEPSEYGSPVECEIDYRILNRSLMDPVGDEENDLTDR